MAGKMRDIENAVDEAIDGPANKEVLDASEVPSYYARQAGNLANQTGAKDDNASNIMQNKLHAMAMAHAPIRSPGPTENDPDIAAHNPNADQALVSRAMFATQANAPYAQGMVKGIGSTGQGSPNAGLMDPATRAMLQGNTYLATPEVYRQDGEGSEEELAQYDPTPGTNDQGTSTPRTANPASSKTPVDSRDAYLLAMQRNAIHAAGGDQLLKNNPMIKKYLDEMAPDRKEVHEDDDGR